MNNDFHHRNHTFSDPCLTCSSKERKKVNVTDTVAKTI